MTWKRLNTETPNYGNGSKITFEEFPFFSLEIRVQIQTFRIIDFRIFCIHLPILIVKCFSKTLRVSSCWPLSSNFWSVSSYFDPFPLFSKTFKISICWLVSSNFRSVSSYFWSVSAYSKTLKISSCWSLSWNFRSVSSYFDPFPLFSKLLKSQFVFASQ